MKRIIFLKGRLPAALVALGFMALASTQGLAEPAVSEPDPAVVDAIIRKMESSETLDAAVERAIDRYVQRKEQARQTEETKRQAKLNDLAKHARAVDASRDHIRGKPTAEVSLIEYTDFECPYCKQIGRAHV